MNDKKTVLLTIWLLLLSCLYLVSWTYTYDTATPAGSDDPAEADDRMREIKAALQERLNVEHVFDLTGTEVSHADTGKHTDITTLSITNAGALANTGNLAVNTDKFTVAAASGNTLVAGTLDVTGVATVSDASLLKTSAAPTTDAMITNKKYVDDQDTADHPAYTGGESHTDGSGLIIKMGRAQNTQDAEQTFTFGTAFPNAVVSVVLTRESPNASIPFTLSEPPTVTSFKIDRHNTMLDSYFDWIAIGY